MFLWDKERDELVAKVFDGEIPCDGDSKKVCVSNEGICPGKSPSENFDFYP